MEEEVVNVASIVLQDCLLSIKRVESVLRGQAKLTPADLAAWTQHCYEFYHRVSSKNALLQYDDSPSAEKTQHLEAAVKLYNKVRNLQSPGLQEIKTVLKGCCAWVFSIFGDKNAKVLSILVKTLSKCGSDFVTLFNQNDLAKGCFAAVIGLWTGGCDANIFKDLPPLEVQILKECVFNSLVHRAEELVGLPEGQGSELRRVMSLTIDLVQSLSARSKLFCVQSMISFAKRIASTVADKDISVKLLQQALNILESPTLLNASDGNHDNHDNTQQDAHMKKEIVDGKVRIFLYLAFIHAESNNIPQATSCVQSIEALESQGLDKPLGHTVLYAKLVVAIREGDIQRCQTLFRALLQHDAVVFDTAIAAAKKIAELIVENGAENQQGNFSEIYKLLALKFPNEPQFTKIRLNHLQTALAAEKSDEGNGAEKSNELVSRIVSDHVNGVRKLEASVFEHLRSLIIDELLWQRDRQMWRRVSLWVDLILQLLEGVPGQIETVHLMRLLKVEAALQLHDYAQALNVAKKALVGDKSIQTAVTYFRCLLHYEDIPKKAVVGHFLQQIYHDNDRESSSQAEDYLRILRDCACEADCCDILTFLQRHEIVQTLLVAWIEYYKEKEMWKIDEEESLSTVNRENIEDVEQKPRLFDIVSSFIYYAQNAADSGGEISSSSIAPSALKDKIGDVTHVVELGSLLHKEDEDSLRKAMNFMLPNLSVQLLNVMNLLLSIVEAAKSRSEIALQALGSADSLLHIAGFNAIVGMIHLSAFPSIFADIFDADNQSVEKALATLQAGSFFYEIAASLYSYLHVIPGTAFEDVPRHQMKCLLLSAGGYLDSFRLLEVLHERDRDQPSCTNSERSHISAKMKEYLENSRKLTNNLQCVAEQLGDYLDEEDQSLVGRCYVLQMASYCFSGSGESCEEFIENTRNSIMRLPLDCLSQCIDLAANSQVCSLNALRTLIGYVLQACMAKPQVPYRMVGSLYRKLIELAPSKRYAFEKLQEVESVLKTLPTDGEVIDQEDIDQIFSLAYNYGITLLDLDQPVLAEQFLLRTMSIIQFTSTNMQVWQPKLRQAYDIILQTKSGPSIFASDSDVLEEGQCGRKRPADEPSSPTTGRVGQLSLEAFKSP
eukprot:gene8541-9414_t